MFKEVGDLTWEILKGKFEESADYLKVEKELVEDYNFRVRSLVSPKINAMLLTQDNDYLIVGSCNFNICVWSFPECRVVCELKGHVEAITALCLNYELRRLYSGSADRTLRAWDYLLNESSLLLYTGTDAIIKIEVVNSQNSLICCCVSGDIIVFSLKIMEVQGIIKAHSEWISCFLVLEEENRIFSGSQDGSVKVWDLNTEIITWIRNKSGITCLEHSINKKTVSFGCYDSTVSIISTENGNVVKHLQINKGAIIALKYLSDSQIAITAMHGFIQILDWTSDTELKSFPIFPTRVNQFLTKGTECLFGLCNTGEIMSIDLKTFEQNFKSNVFDFGFEQGLLSKNEEYIVGYQRDEIGLLNLISKKSEVFKGHTKKVTAYKIYPKYDYLITGSEDNSVKIWKIREKVQKGTLKGHYSKIEKLYISEPTNKVISKSQDFICIWDFYTFSLSFYIQMFKSDSCYLNFSIDKTLLIYFSVRNSSIIKIIDLKDKPTQKIIPNKIEDVDSISINRHKNYLCISSESSIFVLKLLSN